MKKRKLLGAQCLFLSSLILFILSAWEAAVRLDSMYKPIRMFFEMAFGEGIPLSSAMQYFDFSIFEAPLWLFLCMLAALTTIFFIRRPAGTAVILLISLTLSVYGLIREGTFLTDLWRLLQPGLLLFNALLVLLNLPLCRRAGRSQAPDQKTAPRLHDAPKLKKLSCPSARTRRAP